MPCGDPKCLQLLHFNAIYIFWFSVITEPIREFGKLYMRITDDAKWAETRLSGSDNITLLLFRVLWECSLLSMAILYRIYPAGTERWNIVNLTLIQRQDVESHWIDVVSTLCVLAVLVMFASLLMKPLSKVGSTLKEKNLLPTRTNPFLFRLNSSSYGR